LRDGFWIVGDGAPRRVAAVEVGAGVRFNDGKCDPAGRFWAGTMAYDDEPAVGALFRLDPDLSVSKQLSDVTISNGLAWSGDQRTMYYIDTPTRRVDRFAFDPESGSISDRQTVVEIPETSGYPDGMTIDAEEGLWIAMWDGGRIERYIGGRLERIVEMPVSRPTSIAFGGSDYDEMFVTSASTGLTDEERAKQPLAGALFRIRPGVVGVPPVVFEGA
jgi:sugar lactone lactonase YvrE